VPSRVDIGLAEAQLTLARELGHSSWPKLVHHFSGGIESQDKGKAVMSTEIANNLGLSAIDQIGLSCTDLELAQKFYCDVLGLRYGGEAAPMMKFFDCAGVNIACSKARKLRRDR
jgi:hypothetical protein